MLWFFHLNGSYVNGKESFKNMSDYIDVYFEEEYKDFGTDDLLHHAVEHLGAVKNSNRCKRNDLESDEPVPKGTEPCSEALGTHHHQAEGNVDLL